MAKILALSSTVPIGASIFFAKRVMVQNKNKMENELHKPLITFIIIAALEVSPKANMEKKRAINRKKGAPGGWPTSNLYEQAMYSPQSQKMAVGPIVEQYVKVAMAQISQPTMLFNFL